MHERHGASANGKRSRLYIIWVGMRERCRNPNHQAYKHYGARGIAVCDEWADNFSLFRRWAEANGYREDKSIDRINNMRGYSPDNCRWATDKMQARNKRHAVNAKTVVHDGQEITLAELSRVTRIGYTTLVKRFNAGDRGAELTRTPGAQAQRIRIAVAATRNGAAKLTPQQVEEIRASTDSGTALAKRLRVAPSTISMIRSGQRRQR